MGCRVLRKHIFRFFGLSWALKGYCRVIALKDLGFTVFRVERLSGCKGSVLRGLWV